MGIKHNHRNLWGWMASKDKTIIDETLASTREKCKDILLKELRQNWKEAQREGWGLTRVYIATVPPEFELKCELITKRKPKRK